MLKSGVCYNVTMKFTLEEIVTKDGLLLQGIYSESKIKKRRAVLWMHGLSSAFYHEVKLTKLLVEALENKGWGFAHFNSRGHDVLAGIRKKDSTSPYGYSYYQAGAGAEIFEESVLDIDAGIDFLVAKGYDEIVIIGHSTGANKACYYAAAQNNSHVISVILSGPISDRLSSPNTKKHLPFMKKLMREGKGNKLLFGYHFFPLTPKRFISLFDPRSSEDVFDYGEEEPKLVMFSKIKIPLLVILSQNDEVADRPVKEIQQAFDSHTTSPIYKSIVIDGALHRYNGHEPEVVSAIIDWITAL